MLHQTKGIVLHRFKYSDSKVISRILTEKFGLQSYIVFGAGSKMGRMQINLLQPLALIDLQVYHKENSEMQKIKELSVLYPFNSISSDINKNALSYFLAEFLLKTLKENEADSGLYDFVSQTILILERSIDNVNNFHITFLWKLSQYLGIKPQNNYSETNKIFDLQSGKFSLGIPAHHNYLNEKQSKILHLILKAGTEKCHSLRLSINERRFCLNTVLKFYNIHLDRPGELISLKVLTDVFS